MLHPADVQVDAADVAVAARPYPGETLGAIVAGEGRLVMFGQSSLEPVSRKMLSFGLDDYIVTPATPGELVADCFELAVQIRELDMRASPYDLREAGYDPVAIETPEGKAEYVAAQRESARRGAALRSRLLEVCDRLLEG